MRKNLYTKTINDIKISENAVNSAIENIYSKQSNDNIIDIKKSKNKKVNKVIAASLVAAMLVSGGAFALFSQPAQNQNGFVITAAAAELSKNKPVKIAQINPDYAVGFSYKSYEEVFNIMLSCKGDNISSITYTAKGRSYFTVDSNYSDDIYDTVLLTDSEEFMNSDDYSELALLNGKNYASLSVKYDKQFANKNTAVYEDSPLSMNVYLTANDSETAAAVLKKHDIYCLYSDDALLKNARDDYAELLGEDFDKGYDVDNYNKSDLIDMYNELYSQLFEGVSVDVTVKYNDGTEETQTVDFNVEPITEEMADEYLKENGYNGERNSLYNLLGSCATITATLR